MAIKSKKFPRVPRQSKCINRLLYGLSSWSFSTKFHWIHPVQDELDRLDVMMRQYENNKTTACSSAQKSRSNSIQSAGSFVAMTGLDHDSNQTMTNTYEKLQIMKTSMLIKEQHSKKSKGSGASTISQRSRSSNSIHSADSFADMSGLYDMQLTKPRSRSLGLKINTTNTSNVTNLTRSQSVCLSKPRWHDSGETSDDDEQQQSPISIKPRSTSEHHQAKTPRSRSRLRPKTVDIVAVTDNSHLNRISELESLELSDSNVSLHRSSDKPKPKFSLRQMWSNVCNTLSHVNNAKKQ